MTYGHADCLDHHRMCGAKRSWVEHLTVECWCWFLCEYIVLWDGRKAWGLMAVFEMVHTIGS